MTRAEQAALKAYSPHDGASVQWKKAHLSSLSEYIQGYEQAEKDLSLTWEDIAHIRTIDQRLTAELGITRSIEMGVEAFCSEVLKRFNEIRKK